MKKTIVLKAGIFLLFLGGLSFSLQGEEVGGNLALGKPAEQSSTYHSYGADRAVDGNVNTFTHTPNEDDPSWVVDLGREVKLSRVVIHNRTDCCQDRLHDVIVDLSSNREFSSYYPLLIEGEAGSELTFSYQGRDWEGRYLRIRMNGEGQKILSLAEVEVYGTPVAKECPVNTSFFVRDSCAETPSNADCCVCPEGTEYTSVSAGYRQCKN